jgi:hypothetical protein
MDNIIVGQQIDHYHEPLEIITSILHIQDVSHFGLLRACMIEIRCTSSGMLEG